MTDETKSAIEDFNKEQIRVRMDLAEEAKGYSWRPNSAKLIVEPGSELAYIPGTCTIADCGCGMSISGPNHDKVHDSFDSHVCFYQIGPRSVAEVAGSATELHCKLDTAYRAARLVAISVASVMVLRAVLRRWTR